MDPGTGDVSIGGQGVASNGIHGQCQAGVTFIQQVEKEEGFVNVVLWAHSTTL